MPIVEIKLWIGRNKEMKRKLIENVSRTVAETLEISIDRIELIITDVPKENWGKHGVQASELK
jgi:4-oxalocrotonate tautomerase